VSRGRRRVVDQASPTTVDSEATMVSGGNLAGYDVNYAKPSTAPPSLSASQRFMAELSAERGWRGATHA
jgi:hypothetical protein